MMSLARCSRLRKTLLVAGMSVVVGIAATGGAPAWAQQRRARPPEYPSGAFRGVFFEDVTQAIRGERPRIGSPGLAGDRSARSAAGMPAAGHSAGSSTATGNPAGSNSPAGAGSEGGWRALADPVHLEDEVKRLKLAYDSLVTTPGQFRSGGFQDARATLSVMAMVMAVISEYDGRVRFQRDAAVARDLLARSARSVTAGSVETFDEAKQRKADLQDLVSGTGLNRADPAGPTDWSLVGARAPLMEYLEKLLNDPLQSGTTDAAAFGESAEDVDRAAAMVAVVAEVLQRPGMDEADDADYRQLSAAMQHAALEVRQSVAAEDADRARQAVGSLSQSCTACHDQYR